MPHRPLPSVHVKGASLRLSTLGNTYCIVFSLAVCTSKQPVPVFLPSAGRASFQTLSRYSILTLFFNACTFAGTGQGLSHMPTTAEPS